MEMSALPSAMSFPAYHINYTSGTIFASVQVNSSSSHLLAMLTHTTVHPPVAGQNSNQGNKVSVSDNSEEDDSFGEHYFHICIYIWACVVISSLIALSVKWGCCGRSLTRWEVKRIPLKRFQRVDGDDGQDKCPICHEEFHEERLIRQLPCNHCYHSYCVDRWLVKMSNRCPLCKQRVSISVLCPWNKQRRKKEIGGSGGQVAADVEASADESPPVPPLATLTPSNWYGEEIMSGPSRFIILRPGRPTRVVDIRAQKQHSACAKHSMDKRESSQLEHASPTVCGSQTVDDSDTQPGCCMSVGNIPCNQASTGNVCSPLDDVENVFDTDLPTRSVCSSRSCSISSDQPLLVNNQPCSCGSNETEPVQLCCCGSSETEPLDVNDFMQLNNNPKCESSLPHAAHRPEDVSHLQFCDYKPTCKTLPSPNNRSITNSTVSTCDGSTSLVSCAKPERCTSFISRHSASLAMLNTTGHSPSSAFSHKRHTLPGSVAEMLTLLESTPPDISDDVMHDDFRGAINMNRISEYS